MCATIGCCKGGHTFVCFECQTTAKGKYVGREGYSVPQNWTNKTAHPNCPRCRKAMTDLGLKAKIPKNSKWDKLIKKYFGFNPFN